MAVQCLEITYGIHATPIGEIVLGVSDRGVCWLGFMVDGYKGDGLARMRRHFASANLTRDDDKTACMMGDIIDAWRDGDMGAIPIDLHGSDFQHSVWHALLDIPHGQVCHYGDIAHRIGRPKAARAVGSAVGENPVSLIVPCHRVVPRGGGIGNYGWGAALKRDLLSAEGVLDQVA